MFSLVSAAEVKFPLLCVSVTIVKSLSPKIAARSVNFFFRSVALPLIKPLAFHVAPVILPFQADGLTPSLIVGVESEVELLVLLLLEDDSVLDDCELLLSEVVSLLLVVPSAS